MLEFHEVLLIVILIVILIVLLMVSCHLSPLKHHFAGCPFCLVLPSLEPLAMLFSFVCYWYSDLLLGCTKWQLPDGSEK